MFIPCGYNDGWSAMRPKYITYETKEREEFLSQTGNFSPSERDAFHKLCQNWQERIPYNRFTPLLNRGDGATTSDLVTLMTKLRAAGYGILRTAVKEGQRSRDAIILTDNYSERFVSELLDEYFNDLLESISNPLPLLSSLNEDFDDFPADRFVYVPSDKIAREYTTQENPETPLAIESVDSDRLLITRGKLRPCITVSMLKLRYYLSNTSLLELMSRFLDTSLIALKQKVSEKDPQVWLAVSQKIIDKRKEIEALRNIRVDRNFFHAAWLLKRLLESQIAESEQKKRDAENRKVDMEAIAMAVKEAPEGWMTQEQLTRTLDRLKDKYGDSYEEVVEEFYERYVRSQGNKNTLPKIVVLNERYLHRDKIFALFLAHFRETESEVKPYFVSLMESQLKNGAPGEDTTFVDLDNFDHAIQEYIRKANPFLYSMIEKPSILAEGMILHAKQNKLAKDVSELKQRLAIYFDPESMKPLPMHEWFNLRLLEIFETAFERLPILRRIWIRLTGRYESFRSRYISQSAIHRQEQLEKRRAAERAQGDNKKDEGERGGNGASSAGRRAPDGKGRPAHVGTHRRSAATQRGANGSSGSRKNDKDRRGYSKKQVDSAWEQFGSTIKKKDE